MSRIIRVFPRRTSQTPTDDMAFIGDPPLIRPPADEVHVSCVFTWDLSESMRLVRAWSDFYCPVVLGGPALMSPSLISRFDSFDPGLYTKRGIVYTSRGCDKNCPWCLAPKREGPFRELKNVAEGNIIQDNNILQASKDHLRKVFGMLWGQRRVRFLGGLDCTLLKPWHIEEFRSVRIDELWLSLDCGANIPSYKKACSMLRRAGFSRDKIRTYCLVGWPDGKLGDAEDRLRLAWESGSIPFAQYYQPSDATERQSPNRELARFVRKWSRPASIRAMMKDGSKGNPTSENRKT